MPVYVLLLRPQVRDGEGVLRPLADSAGEVMGKPSRKTRPETSTPEPFRQKPIAAAVRQVNAMRVAIEKDITGNGARGR